MTSVSDQLVQAIELQNCGQLAEATTLFQEILATEPSNAAALYSLAVIYLNAGKYGEALELSNRGCYFAPAFAPMRFVQGAALQAAGRKVEALQSYDAALAIKPDFIEVLINSGAMLRDMLQHGAALERFNRVLAIDPNYAPALANCGIILTEYKQSEQAIAMFERLLALKPDYEYGLGLLVYERLHAGDWTEFHNLKQAIAAGVKEGKRVCKTLAFMALSDIGSEHFLCARIFAHHYCPPPHKALWKGEKYSHKKIRIAYVSPDLREHPVGHLMAGVFESHDKSKFETIAISLGIDDQSRLRGRMLDAFDHFIDARELSARQIAERLREMEVDIAVDLAGYTSDSRMEIFAYRPAPIQVGFLGYPGTLGVSYFDYILADEHVIPVEHQPFYSERIAYLPNCYLPTDTSIEISEATPTREACGLPETGFVFCAFSHDYKISPPLWKVWMRLLDRVPGSVLWLVSRSDLSQKNFRKAAEDHGIDSARLIFAKRVPRVEDHLARYRLADLFLDTWPYNAHTTAADALMAGLPVVTYMGNAFPARVAGSLLHAAGLPDLVTHSLDEYENLAFKLVSNPELLADVKLRLKSNRSQSPLFDTRLFTRNLESVYAKLRQETELG